MLSCAGKSRLFCLFLDIEDPVRKLHLVRTPPPKGSWGTKLYLLLRVCSGVLSFMQNHKLLIKYVSTPIPTKQLNSWNGKKETLIKTCVI